MDCNKKCDECGVGIILKWLETEPEAKTILEKPEVVEALKMTIVEFAGGLLVIPPIGSAMSSIAQMGFLLGYKRGLETAKLDNLHNKKVK
jgi:hypothetical protein